MSIKIYHQVGHQPNWNTEAFTADHCGHGLILSPVHQKHDQVTALDTKIRRCSIFDPQFYLPNSPKAKLATYSFFPETIIDGFSTIDFLQVAHESANQCISFQIEQQFEVLIIPSRFIDQMATKYFENQEKFTVRPFLKAIAATGTSTPVFLSLPITSAMLEDEGFRTKLLNWVTGFPEISGVYLVVSDPRSTKQIRSANLLFSYLAFAQELSGAGLKIILGHLNTESVLLTLIDGVSLTFGSFENTRIFSLDKFIDNDEIRLGPKPRIYMPTLLNWIQFRHALQIREGDMKVWEKVYAETKYNKKVLAAAAEPHFSQPDLYKDHFLQLSAQIEHLGALPVEKRFNDLKGQVKRALSLHNEVASIPVDLDQHGNGEHLGPWLDAMNSFYKTYLKS